HWSESSSRHRRATQHAVWPCGFVLTLGKIESLREFTSGKLPFCSYAACLPLFHPSHRLLCLGGGPEHHPGDRRYHPCRPLGISRLEARDLAQPGDSWSAGGRLCTRLLSATAHDCFAFT